MVMFVDFRAIQVRKRLVDEKKTQKDKSKIFRSAVVIVNSKVVLFRFFFSSVLILQE